MRILSTIEEVEDTSTSSNESCISSSNFARKKILTEQKITRAVKACQNGEYGIVKTLLDSGLDVDQKDDEKCTLLHWAAINNRSDIIKLLLSYNATVNIIGGILHSTPLHWACYTANMDAAVLLILNGADPSIRNVGGESALHIAAQSGNSMLIAYLLIKFANIKDLRDNSGQSALMIAVEHSFGMFPIKIFTTADVYLDFRDDQEGNTALHSAMKKRNDRGSIELLVAGADDLKTNKKGETPMAFASPKEQKNLREQVKVKKMLKNGTLCDKIFSLWFLKKLLSATLPGIISIICFLLFHYFNVIYFAVFGVLSAIILVIIFYVRPIQAMSLFPVSYICTMGVVEICLLCFYTDGMIHWYFLIPMLVIWVISGSLYWILIFWNPGVVPKSQNPFQEYVELLERGIRPDRYCFTCWVPRLPNSHHCSVCDSCVDDFDHHCPWLNKCIYRANLRPFVMFIFMTLLFNIFYCALIAFTIFASISANSLQYVLMNKMILIFSCILSCVHVSGAGMIFWSQITQISINVSTIQRIKRNMSQSNSSESSSESSNNKPEICFRLRNLWTFFIFDSFGEDSSRISKNSLTSFSNSPTVSME